MAKPAVTSRRGKSFLFDEAAVIPELALGRGDWNTGFWRNEFEKNWEEQTFDILDRFLDSDHSMLDVGAWIGPTALYASRSARHVYALEPDPVSHFVCLSNLLVNPDIQNITLIRAALAPENGTVLLGGNGPLGNSESTMLVSDPAYINQTTVRKRTHDEPTEKIWRDTPCVNVDAVTIETLFSQCQISDCNLAKVDIEGGERLIAPLVVPFLASRAIPLYISVHWCYLTKTQVFEVLGCLMDAYPIVYSADLNRIRSVEEAFSSGESFLCVPTLI